MTTVDLANGPAVKAPKRLTLLLGGLLLGNGGRLSLEAAVATAMEGQSGARSAHRLVADAMRPLLQDGVAVRRDDTWYAPNIADLAAWVADGWQYREDAGRADNVEVPPPAIPAPRGSRRAA